MMSMTMFGADESTSTTTYSDLTDAACSLIPACAAVRGLSKDAQDAANQTVDESLAKAQATATQVMAPTLAQLQRLEKAITWAAVGTVTALALATGALVWVSLKKKKG